jgi:O-succinylbenzoic acid--CoA ligase
MGPRLDFLRDASLRAPHDLALDEAGRAWSYGELDARVERMAGNLRAALAREGPVALLLENGGPLVAALHAAARLGRVAAPLFPKLTAFEVAVALRALDASAIVADAVTESVAREASGQIESGTQVLSVAGLESGALTARDTGTSPRVGTSPRGPSTDWAVLWTSGTEGRPRGVVLTAENLAASADASRERLALGPGDRWYLALACAHVGGLALVTRAARLGAAVVTRGSFSAEVFNQLVDKGSITHASLVPTMLLRALDERRDRAAPRSLRCLLLGGASTPRALVERALAAGFPIALTYGLTEACSQVATAPPELVARKPGTVGAPLRGTDVRIDEAGEILVRGPTVAAGYLGVDQSITDSQGWLHTGDLGELDHEGHLSVTGRRSDRIISGGVNVDPSEVESVLRLHPDVRDVAVVGIPDEQWGEVVVAAVVPGSESSPSRTDLESLARERLSPTKVPRRILFLGVLPRNANGKVDRDAVKTTFAAPRGGAEAGR